MGLVAVGKVCLLLTVYREWRNPNIEGMFVSDGMIRRMDCRFQHLEDICSCTVARGFQSRDTECAVFFVYLIPHFVLCVYFERGMSYPLAILSRPTAWNLKVPAFVECATNGL